MNIDKELYPEVDIRKDKTAKICLFLCFMRDRTMAVKATTIDEVKERCADEPAFHIAEISDGRVFNHLAGLTKVCGKEIIMTRKFCPETERIINVLMVLNPDGTNKVLSEQRRLPREYLRQLDNWWKDDEREIIADDPQA